MAKKQSGLPFDLILGAVTVFPGDPDWDIDLMCVLYFVDFNAEPRIGFVTG